MGKRKKRVAELTSSGTDDVFKIKHKSLKKSKPTTVKNAKSRQALRHGQDLLDDQFVHLHHQQQLQSANTSHVAKVHTPTQHTDIQDTVDRLANL